MIEIHKHFLEVAVEACRSLPAEIETHVAMVSSLPKEMVKLRLIAVEGLIKAGQNALRVQHDNKGFIFVQASQNLLALRWSELDILKGKKKSTSSGESIFYIPEVILKKIEELIDQVDSSELTPAVQWLNRYKSIDVDGVSCLP